MFRQSTDAKKFSTKVVSVSLVPRPSPVPVFDRLQYAKKEGECLVILPRDPRHRHHKSSRAYMHSHAREKTDLEFCTSYEDETSADGEIYQAYKTYPS